MRMRAMGLSATSITSAPASASRLAPASSLWVESPRGGSISTAIDKLPGCNFCASWVGCSAGRLTLLARRLISVTPLIMRFRVAACRWPGHDGDMARGRAAAAADHFGAGLPEGQRIFAEIFRCGRVLDPPADLFGPAGIRHDRKARLRDSLVHLLEDAQELVGPAGAVDRRSGRRRIQQILRPPWPGHRPAGCGHRG